jgi:hypothetical protein
VHVAVEYIQIEYRTASFFFALAVITFHLCLIGYAWGYGPPLVTKLLLTALAIYSLHLTLLHSRETSRRFWVDMVRLVGASRVLPCCRDALATLPSA